MKRRFYAARDWSLHSPRRAMATGAVLAGVLCLVIVIGPSLWAKAAADWFVGSAGARSSTIPALPPTPPPSDAGIPPRPQDGPRSTSGTSGTATASLPSYAPTSEPDRGNASDVAAEFTRRWLDGAGRDQGQVQAWSARLLPLASPGLRVDLTDWRLANIPTAQLLSVSEPSRVLGDRAVVTATLSTGRILQLNMLNVRGAIGVPDGWTVSGVK